MGGENETSKNALTELYYNLSLEVLSEEYTESAAYQAIGNLVVEISFELQKSIRSNKLKRKEDEEKNKKIKEEMFKFKPETTDFQKTEQQIVQSIMDNEPFLLQKKTKNNYVEPKPEKIDEIENEYDKNKKDYLQTAFEFNKVDLSTAKDTLKKKKDGILDAATDLPSDNVKIDDDVKIDDIIIDDHGFFDEKDLKQEDREYLKNLLKKQTLQKSEH